MNLNRMAAMYQINDQEAAMSNYPYGEPHSCDESQGDGEVKLACGCMLPVIAGTLSPDGQTKLKQWQAQMVPCSRGRINGTRIIVMRDTGSTTCVVKKSLVKLEQMTGSYELCRLIDGVVKCYPTAMVELDTPYFIGKTKVLCMDNPVQDIIIGNIPGASGVHPNLVNTKATVTPNKVSSTQSLHTGILKANRELSKAVQEPVTNSEICLNTNTFAVDVDTTTDMCVAVQTRAMVARESKPPKLLKVKSVPGLDIGPEELKVKQKADELLKRIWTDEDEDPEVKTLYQYVADLRDRVKETCKMAKGKVKVKFSHTRYRALGPELIPVYRQSARR